MRKLSGWRLVLPGLLLVLSILFASCGSDNQNNQNRQPLRLTLRFDTGYVDEPYNTTLTADGGIRPYKFSLEGNLPKGLTYSNGRISGTPQEKGNFELTVSVEDANLSNRTQKVTLTIGETTPPRLDQVFPLAEVSDPFPYLFRVRDREARGFQAQIPLKDLKTTLDSFKADAGVLYVLRYDEEKGLVDIDAVFTGPRKDFEAFRFTATPLPDKKVRPEASFRETRVAFYDKNSKLAGNAQAIERVNTQGRYKYSDLEAIARNWGRRLTSATAPQAPVASTAQAPANNPPQGQADAEVLELAWEALQLIGFPEAKIEVGLPALVRDLLEATGLPEDQKERLRQAIHRKNSPELEFLLDHYQVHPGLHQALRALPDLYGGREVLEEARRLPLSAKAQADLDWLEAVLALLPEVPLLLDLGRARLLTFYTGLNFQAYTPDFGLPLLGGGRYDGALLPYAAGFALGLERVMEALRLPLSETPPEVLALDQSLARKLRAEGKRVELAWTNNLTVLREYALEKGIRWLARDGKLEEVRSR